MIIAILLPLVLGTALLSLVISRESGNILEKIALAFLAGLLLLVMMVFLLGRCALPINLLNLLIFSAGFIFAAAAWLIYNKRFLFGWEDLRFGPANKLLWWEWVMIVLVSFKVLYLFFAALIKPVIDIDAISMYTIGAKEIFISQRWLDPLFFKAIQDKPPFAYFSQAWVFIAINDFNDCLVKVLTPVMFVCFLVIFYSVLRRWGGRGFAWLFTFLLSTLPFMVFHVATAYADFPQMVYYSVGTLYLALFIKNVETGQPGNNRDNLLLAMLFLAFTIWIKRGGVFFAFVDILVITGYFAYKKCFWERTGRSTYLGAITTFVVFAAPWLIYSRSQVFFGALVGTAGGMAEQVGVLGEWDKLLVVTSTLAKKLFLYADWHLLLFFLVIILFFFIKQWKRPVNLAILAIIVLDFLAIIFDFTYTATFQWIYDGTLLDRLVMSIIPAILFFCAISASQIFQSDN